MRKPISKHALRRAMERVQAEGLLRWEEPTGAVVDRLWHEVEKEMYGDGAKKKTPSRKRIVAPAVPASPEYPEPEYPGEA